MQLWYELDGEDKMIGSLAYEAHDTATRENLQQVCLPHIAMNGSLVPITGVS